MIQTRKKQFNNYDETDNIKRLKGGSKRNTIKAPMQYFTGGKIDMFNPLTYWVSHIFLMKKYNGLRKQLDKINRELEKIKPLAESLVLAYQTYDKVSVELLDKYKIIMRMLIAREYEKNRILTKDVKHQREEVMTNYTNAKLALENIKQSIKADSLAKKQSDKKDLLKAQKKINEKMAKFAKAFEKIINFESYYAKVYEVIKVCKAFGEKNMMDSESKKKQRYCRIYAKDYEKLYNFNAEAKDKQAEVKNLINKYDAHLMQIEANYKANQGKKGELETKMNEWKKKYLDFTKTLNEISEGKIVAELGEILQLIDKIKEMYIRSNDASILSQVDKYYEALRLGVGDIQEYFKSIQKEITTIYEYILKGGLAAGLRNRINDVAKLHADAISKFILIHTSYDIYCKTGGWKGKIGAVKFVGGGNLPVIQYGGAVDYINKYIDLLKKIKGNVNNGCYNILDVMIKIPNNDDLNTSIADRKSKVEAILTELNAISLSNPSNITTITDKYISNTLKKATDKDKLGNKYIKLHSFLEDYKKIGLTGPAAGARPDKDILKTKINLNIFRANGKFYINGVGGQVQKDLFDEKQTYIIKYHPKPNYYLLKIGTGIIDYYKNTAAKKYTFKKENEIKNMLFYCYCFSDDIEKGPKDVKGQLLKDRAFIKLDDKTKRFNIMLLDFKTGFPILSRWYKDTTDGGKMKLAFNLIDCGYRTDTTDNKIKLTEQPKAHEADDGNNRKKLNSILDNLKDANAKAVASSIILNAFEDICITADSYLQIFEDHKECEDQQYAKYKKLIEQYDAAFMKYLTDNSKTTDTVIQVEDFTKLNAEPDVGSPAAIAAAAMPASIAAAIGASAPAAAAAIDPATGLPLPAGLLPVAGPLPLIGGPQPVSGVLALGSALPLGAPQSQFINPRLVRLEQMFKPIEDLEKKLLELISKIIKKYRIDATETEGSKINENKISTVQSFIIALEEEERKMIDFKTANPKDPVIAGWDFKKIQTEITVIDSSEEIKKSLEVAKSNQLSAHMQLIESTANYNAGDIIMQIDKYIQTGDNTGQLLNQTQWLNVRDAFRNATLMYQLTHPNLDGLDDAKRKNEVNKASRIQQCLAKIIQANQNNDVFGYNNQGPNAVAFYNFLKQYKHTKEDDKKTKIKNEVAGFIKKNKLPATEDELKKIESLETEQDVRNFISVLSSKAGAPAINVADIDELIKKIKGEAPKKDDAKPKIGGNRSYSLKNYKHISNKNTLKKQ